MKEKLDLMKNLDYFANPFQATFKNKTYFTSWLGVFMTLFILILAIAITITTGNQLFKKEKPTVNQIKGYQYIPDNYTLSSNQIPFSYRFEGDLSKLLDPTYYVVSISNFLNKRYIGENGEAVFESNTYKLEYELCGNNPEKYLEKFNTIGNFTELLTVDGFTTNHICVKSDDVVIGGNYYSEFFSNIMFEIKKCVNSTKNNNSCKSEEEIIDVTLGENFAFSYIDTNPISTNYTDPFQRLYTSYFIKLDPHIYMAVDLYFSYQNMTTDAGFIFEEYVTLNTFKFDRFREIYNINSSKPERVLRLYFNIGQNTITIERYYMKIQELIALVGGILKSGIIVGFAITKFFSFYLFDELLINSFFDVKNIEESNRNIKPIFSSKTVKLVNLNSDKINKLSPAIRKRTLDARKSVIRNRDNSPIKGVDGNALNNNSNYNKDVISNNIPKNNFSNLTIDTASGGLVHNKQGDDKNMNKEYISNHINVKDYNESNANSNYNSNYTNNPYLSNNYYSERTNTRLNDKVKAISGNENNFNSNINKNNDIYHLGYVDIINMFLCPCRPISKNKNMIHKLYKEKLNEYSDYSEVINEIISFRYFKEYIIYNDIDINVEGSSKVKIDFNPYIVNEDPHLKAFIQSFTHLTKERLINEKIFKKMLKLIKKEQKYMD